MFMIQLYCGMKLHFKRFSEVAAENIFLLNFVS
jgi:hypothetical protein